LETSEVYSGGISLDSGSTLLVSLKNAPAEMTTINEGESREFFASQFSPGDEDLVSFFIESGSELGTLVNRRNHLGYPHMTSQSTGGTGTVTIKAEYAFQTNSFQIQIQ